MKKKFIINDQEIEVEIIRQSAAEVSFIFQDKSYSYSNRKKTISCDDWNDMEDEQGKHRRFLVYHGSQLNSASGNSCKLEVMLDNKYFKVNINQQVKQQASGSRKIYSPLPGKIIAILKENGASINPGDEIVRLEAMKMEHRICAETNGVIALKCENGQQIVAGDLLAEINDENS